MKLTTKSIQVEKLVQVEEKQVNLILTQAEAEVLGNLLNIAAVADAIEKVRPGSTLATAYKDFNQAGINTSSLVQGLIAAMRKDYAFRST
jgi:hypothetical protein